jgi:membrane protein
MILFAAIISQTSLFNLEQFFQMLKNSNLFPDMAIMVIESTLTELKLPTSSISFYIIVVIWSASRGIRAVMNGIHMAFRTREAHNLFLRFLLSFFYTICFVFLLVLFTVLVLFGDSLFTWLSSVFNLSFLVSSLVRIIRYLIPLGFMLILYTLLYKVIPAKNLHVLDVFPGSLFAALSSFLISHLFSLYTSNFANYSALYGSIAGVIIICTWMFLFSLMLVIGAEINACIYEIRNSIKTNNV